MSEPLHWTPWFAYDCMKVAYEEQRWWSAHTIARMLLDKVETPGSDARRWFSLKRWIVISDIERCSRERLAENETQPTS